MSAVLFPKTPTSPVDGCLGKVLPDAAQQPHHLLPHGRRQQEVHDGIQAAVECREEQGHLFGLVDHAPPVAGRVGDLGDDVEDAHYVVGHEAHGIEEEDEEGLFGRPGIAGRVGQVGLLLGRPQQLEGDLDVAHHHAAVADPEDDHQQEVGVALPLGVLEYLILEASGRTREQRPRDAQTSEDHMLRGGTGPPRRTLHQR